MDWDSLDFAVFGAMALGVVVIGLLARRASRSSLYRLGVGVALATSFILVWVNGAVGIIGDEGNDANLMFFAVLAAAAVVALLARFRPAGMVWAMVVAAVAQAAVAVVALVGNLGAAGSSWPGDILMLTLFFVILWLLSAWLFKRAARRHYAGKHDLRG